jgi:hypothetical protein
LFKKKDGLDLKNTIKSIYESIEIITVLDKGDTIKVTLRLFELESKIYVLRWHHQR